MWVELTDGWKLRVPLAWFPRLLRATPAEREQIELSRVGMHRSAIDEDISIEGLLAHRSGMRASGLDALADEALAAHRAGRSLEVCKVARPKPREIGPKFQFVAAGISGRLSI
jgi:hypothetical protein